MNVYEIYQGVLTHVCLACFLAASIALLACALARFLSPIVAWMRTHKVDALIVLPFVVCLVFYGGSKGTGSINYPRTDPEVWYLMNNGSYVTNDAVHVAFSRNLIVPATAMFYLFGLELSYTNESDWAEHSFCAYSNSFAAITVPFDVAYPAATNFNWIGFTDWTPAPSTHTNGVAYVAWQIGVGKPTNDVALVRTGVYVDALRLAPNPAITNGIPLEAGLRSIMEVQDE